MLSGWGVNEWVAISSAALAVVSFVFNWLVVRRQGQLQVEGLKIQMDGEVIQWAHEAIDAIAAAIMLARGRGAVFSSDEFRRRQLEAAQNLSALADRGRLFFPNFEAAASRNDGKDAAFQGFRPPILDAVIFAVQQVDRIAASEPGPDAEAAAYLVRCRRLLVSEVQAAVDPRRRSRVMARLTRGSEAAGASGVRSAAELGEALEARYPGVLIQRRDETWIAEREDQARRMR